MALLSSRLDWSLANPKWAALLNTFIGNLTNQMVLIPNVNLVVGNNIINTGLGRQMTGWFITDIQGAATIYRSAPLNDKTLTLNSSASVSVEIGVF